MENFTWERPILDLFAAHYETGEKLPAELVSKMMQARNFRSATGIVRSAGLGMMDILFHTDYTASDAQGDPLTFGRQVMQRYSPATLPPEYAQPASFSHIFSGGYAAGYYSYQWAQVLDADAFTRFRREGILNTKTAESFRRSVLEKGNQAPAGQLFRDFMGRDPDVKALLERSGLDLKQNMK
jgi:oligopeptidase A